MVEKYKPKPLNKTELVNGYKLMLEFMGYEYTNDDPQLFPKGYFFNHDNGHYMELHHCTIEEDWNLIHELLDKIKPIECSYKLSEIKSTLWNTTYRRCIQGYKYIYTFLQQRKEC